MCCVWILYVYVLLHYLPTVDFGAVDELSGHAVERMASPLTGHNRLKNTAHVLERRFELPAYVVRVVAVAPYTLQNNAARDSEEFIKRLETFSFVVFGVSNGKRRKCIIFWRNCALRLSLGSSILGRVLDGCECCAL